MADLTGVPGFLQNLISKLKENPTAADIALMKTLGVRELAVFFDTMAEGKSDRDRYDAVLTWLRNGKKGLPGAAPAPAAAPATAPIQKTTTVTASSSSATTTGGAPAGASADAGIAKAAPSAAAPAAEKEKKPYVTGTCAQCGKAIEDREYLENDGMKLHNACLAAWEEENCPKCAQCGKLIPDDYVTLSRGDVKATLHEGCVDAYKKAMSSA
jgi:hypothetical protein